MGVIIVNGDESHDDALASSEHCPECERRFDALEQRIAAIEQHHPIMDSKTTEAQETADEAMEMAEEAQETAEAAALVAEMTAITETRDDEPGEEEELGETVINDEERDLEAGTTSGGEEAETGGDSEPVIIAVEPERATTEQHQRTYHFKRGKR